MGGTSKEQWKEEHTRRRKEWARITEELEDVTKMSSEYELELLLQKKELAVDIYVDLKEEERILQDYICDWEYDIEILQRAIDRREFPDPDPSSGEEEEEEESENAPQCATCLAQKSEERNEEEEYSEEEYPEEEESSRYDSSE